MVASFLLAMSSAPLARGQVLVLASSEGEPVKVEEHRVAVAFAQKWTVWMSFQFGTSSPAAFIVGMPGGAVFDFPGEHWLDSLDDATAPRVMPPAGNDSACVDAGTGKIPVENTAQPWASLRIDPLDLSDLASQRDLRTWVAERSFALSSKDEELLAQTPPTTHFVAMSFAAGVNGSTPTLRWTHDAKSEKALDSFVPNQGVATTLWLIADSEMLLGGISVRLADSLGTVWLSASSRSDYLVRRERTTSVLNQWVFEAAGNEPIFSWQLLPDGAGAISPIAQSYPSQPATQPDDFTLALEGIPRDQARITRLRGLPTNFSQPLASSADIAVYPIVRATGIDSTGCSTVPVRSGTVTAPVTPDDKLGPPIPTAHPEPPPKPVPSGNGDSGCSGNSSSSQSNDGCSGNSSSSSRSNDGCSGDSSSSSSGDGCSGDSSSSSGGGDSCSGDSSSPSGGGDGCSGDSSSGSGCSGDSSGAGSGCTVRARHRHHRVIITLYALGALLLPLRRAARRGARASRSFGSRVT
jgi:hypothetical protein